MNYITSKDKNYQSKVLHNLLDESGFKDIEDFQQKHDLVVDGIFGIKTFDSLYNHLLNVKSVDFHNYYFRHEHQKKQIIWHHSAGWDNARGMFEWWKKDGATHVATAIGIVDDGTVYRGFDEKYWAASIGAKNNVFVDNGVKLNWAKNQYGKWYATNNINLDKAAVAVEICNWGNLTKVEDEYYSWADTVVDEGKVCHLSYKGQNYYEAYTDEEIQALKYWTLLQAIRFDIFVDYDEDRFWEVNKDALSGKAGLYTHNSYRFDKTDVSPQPKLIKMAKSLLDYSR